MRGAKMFPDVDEVIGCGCIIAFVGCLCGAAAVAICWLVWG